MRIISAVFADSVIREGFGKLAAIYPFLIRHQFFCQLAHSPACGWYVYVAAAFPPARHYRSVLAGILRSPLHEDSGHKEVGMPRIQQKFVFFRESHATMYLTGGFGSQGGNPQGFSPDKELSENIFDRGYQVCRIISA